MEKEYLETIDGLKKYMNSDEFKSMEKELIELIKKCEINRIKYGCGLIFDDKDNIIGHIRNIERKEDK